MKSEEVEAYLNEARLLSVIDNPNVIKMKRVYESSQFIFILMELAEGGTLKGFLNKRKFNKVSITEDEASLIIGQILFGLVIIHKHHIVHKDIKPRIILLKMRGELEGSIAIADFGL